MHWQNYNVLHMVKLLRVRQQFLLGSNKIPKEMHFLIKRDSSNYLGLVTSPNVGMVQYEAL
jgi:hypothetical protein